MSKRMRNGLKASKGIKQLVEEFGFEEVHEPNYVEEEYVEEEYDEEEEYVNQARPTLKQQVSKWKTDEHCNRYPVYEVAKWKRVSGIRVPVYSQSKK